MENKNDSNDDVEFNWESDNAKAGGGGVSDGVKKLVSTGLTFLMSDEGVRQYLQDIKNPKEAMGSVLKGIAKSKEEIVTRVGDEITKLVEKIDIVEELTKFLRENKIKVSAEIEFSKKNKKDDE